MDRRMDTSCSWTTIAGLACLHGAKRLFKRCRFAESPLKQVLVAASLMSFLRHYRAFSLPPKY